jgi:hypothetical protein
MAIMDSRLEFCDATTLVGATGTTVRGHTIDLGVANKDYADGTPIYMHARIGATAAATTSGLAHATLAFVLQEAAVNTPASFGTAVTLKSATATSTSYGAGYKIYDGALPTRKYKRYLRLVSTIATSVLVAGTCDAWINLDPVS